MYGIKSLASFQVPSNGLSKNDGWPSIVEKWPVDPLDMDQFPVDPFPVEKSPVDPYPVE
jgi:hypothetical protein